jgi:lipopolysaccharide heptosyltransferase I
VRVLIVKMSALGDIIHALPVLDYLHRVAPGIEIDWIVEEPFREVLDGNRLISRIHTVRTKAWRKHPLALATLREIGALKRSLRERKFDLLFDIQGNLKSGLACLLSGVHDRLGFAREGLQEPVNIFFTTRQTPLRRQDYHITDQYLRVVSVPFGKDFTEMRLATEIQTSAEEDAEASTLLATLANGLVFFFHCGTTWPAKLWYHDGWVALGKAVTETYPDSSILLSWGNETEREEALAIAAAIGSGARVIERYSLKGLAALLKKVDLVVGGDTGPVHLAATVGTPTVSFYRASDGRRSGPRGGQHAIVQAPLPCTACFQTTCDKDDACRKSVTVDMLLAAIKKVLS